MPEDKDNNIVNALTTECITYEDVLFAIAGSNLGSFIKEDLLHNEVIPKGRSSDYYKAIIEILHKKCDGITKGRELALFLKQTNEENKMDHEKDIVMETNNETTNNPVVKGAKKTRVNLNGVKEGADKAVQFLESTAKDVGEFAEAQFKNAKSILDKVSKNVEDSLSKQRLEKYRPIFPETFDKDNFVFPDMINVVEFDKRMGVEECRGAIGYQERINNVEVLGIYKAEMDKYGIKFLPEKTETLYYVHPLQKNVYIEVGEYFNFLKEARVAELGYIAQSLGAKHFKVTIIEESSSEQIKKTKGGAKLANGKDKGGVNVETESNKKKYNFLGIADENRYPGKDPIRPELKFWANSASIKSLVEQRMDLGNPLLFKTYRLDYNARTGIKTKEAAKIDGVLKSLKFSGAGRISDEVKSESKKRFEYTIEF